MPIKQYFEPKSLPQQTRSVIPVIEPSLGPYFREKRKSLSSSVDGLIVGSPRVTVSLNAKTEKLRNGCTLAIELTRIPYIVILLSNLTIKEDCLFFKDSRLLSSLPDRQQIKI